MSAISQAVQGFFESSFLSGLNADPAGFFLPYAIWISRLILPLLAFIVVWRAGRSVLRGRAAPETWAWLRLGDGVSIPVNHWENIIGRSGSADIVLPLPQISRSHAALIREASGGWRLYDIARKNNLLVNGIPVADNCELGDGDLISVNGTELVLAEITPEEEQEQRASRPVPGREIRPSRTLSWLTLFILVLAAELMLAQNNYAISIGISFSWLLFLMWFFWLLSRSLRRTGFEIEIVAFFLCSLGMAVVASGAPQELTKQCLTITLGLLGFFILGWILRDMRRIKALRWPAAGAALLLLAYVLLFGEDTYGARNWITIFGYSLQPSELVKVLFLFAGGATLDRLFARRNLYAFIALTAAIVGGLALMNDFGGALIFFTAYLIIAYLRSGDLATISLSVAGAALGVIMVLAVKPHVAERFATWGHAWEFAASGGFQQTRAMTVVASGGLFGLGGGEGWLKQVAAADTDLVFAFVAEEWGLIIAFAALAALIIVALFAVAAAFNARSSYYVIAACATAGMLLIQTMLNVGGSLDLLPLTGVTFPFVSNGGSSMIASWCMLAFLKAADTRQNASFAIRLPRHGWRQGKELLADE
jgi:cell division protein FtsW